MRIGDRDQFENGCQVGVSHTDFLGGQRLKCSGSIDRCVPLKVRTSDPLSRILSLGRSPNALVQNLPDQTTEPVGDGTDGLRVSKARDEPAVDDRKDRPLRLHRGVGGLIQHAAHLSIAFGAAVTVVDAGTLLIARSGAHPGRELFRRWKRGGAGTDFRDDLLRGLLQALGISLRSATEPIDDTSTGKLMEGVLAAFAQFDNDCRSDRTRAGMKAALELGRWVFLAPLGYLNAPRAIGKSLMTDPERAPLVRRAFEEYATRGYTKEQLLKQTSVWGLTNRRGRPLTSQAIGMLLRNRLYAGIVDVPEYGVRAKRGDFQPLISEDLFYRVQAVLFGRVPGTTPQQRAHPDFPLRAFVSREFCGRGLTGSWSRGRSRHESAQVTFREGTARTRFQEAFEGECAPFISESHEDIDSPTVRSTTYERTDRSYAPRAVLAAGVNSTVMAGENLTVGSTVWLPAEGLAPGR